MAKKDPGPAAPVNKRAQMKLAIKMTMEADKKAPYVVVGGALADFVVVFVLGLLIGHPIFGTIMAVLTAFLTGMFLLASRGQKAAIDQVRGQPGAAVAVLNTLKRKWTVTPAVAVSRNQDIIHRAVGRAGIVLIAEGSPTRVGNLLAAEKKRMNRFVADAPVHEVVIGEGEGQVEIGDLTKHLTKMKMVLKPHEVTAINDRLRAVGDVMKNVPLPKGPMPPTGGKQARGRIR